MASVIKTTEETSMADDELPEDLEPKKGLPSKGEKSESLAYARKGVAAAPGFFTVYKKGQGYWTRVGSVLAAVMIGAFTVYNLYAYTPTLLPDSVSHATGLKIGAAVATAFGLGYALLCWWLLNKTTNVDFLIATDSEMKKVNWTSRKELVGSTQIVIIFMFLVALFLFGVDQIFGWLMYWINVLKVSPFG